MSTESMYSNLYRSIVQLSLVMNNSIVKCTVFMTYNTTTYQYISCLYNAQYI